MTSRVRTKLVRAGEYAAEVEVEFADGDAQQTMGDPDTKLQLGSAENSG